MLGPVRLNVFDLSHFQQLVVAVRHSGSDQTSRTAERLYVKTTLVTLRHVPYLIIEDRSGDTYAD